jgi:hypothetical protein
MSSVKSVAGTILIVLAAINVVACILLVSLMRYMHVRRVLRMNLYLYFVIGMTVFQALYDVSFFLENSCETGTCGAYFYPSFGVCGITSCLFAMLILTCALQTAITRTALTPMMIRIWMVILSIVPIVAGACIYSDWLDTDSDRAIHSYNITRVSIVSLSFVQMLILCFIVFRRSSTVARDIDPLHYLMRKIIWYPVVMIISRLGGSLYNLVYGQTISAFPSDASFTQTLLLIVFVICIPSAGLASLIVFLSTQNGAVLCFKRMFVFCCGDVGEIPEELVRVHRRPPANLRTGESASSGHLPASSPHGAGAITSPLLEQEALSAACINSPKQGNAVEHSTITNHHLTQSAERQSTGSGMASLNQQDRNRESERLAHMDELDLIQEYVRESSQIKAQSSVQAPQSKASFVDNTRL